MQRGSVGQGTCRTHMQTPQARSTPYLVVRRVITRRQPHLIIPTIEQETGEIQTCSPALIQKANQTSVQSRLLLALIGCTEIFRPLRGTMMQKQLVWCHFKRQLACCCACSEQQMQATILHRVSNHHEQNLLSSNATCPAARVNIVDYSLRL